MTYTNTILVGVDYSDNSLKALKEASRIANAHEAKLVVFHILDEEALKYFYDLETYQTSEGLLSAYDKLDAYVAEHLGTANELSTVVVIGNPFSETIKLVKHYKPLTLVLGSKGNSSKDYSHVGALASKCVRKAPTEVLLVRETQERPFERIIACVDFSENSMRAVHSAAAIAKQDGANLRLIHVYHPPIYADTGIGWLGPAFPVNDVPDVDKKLKNKLHNIAMDIGTVYDLPDISTRLLRNFSPVEGIYNSLREVEADLCVLCTRGRTGLKKLLLGTTAESIINMSPCSTLVVKPSGFNYELS